MYVARGRKGLVRFETETAGCVEHMELQLQDVPQMFTRTNKMGDRAVAALLELLTRAKPGEISALRLDHVKLATDLNAKPFAWEANEWCNSVGNALPNQELWQQYVNAMRAHKLQIDFCFAE